MVAKLTQGSLQPETIAKMVPSILQASFAVLSHNGSGENEYVMMCVSRCFVVAGPAAKPIAEVSVLCDVRPHLTRAQMVLSGLLATLRAVVSGSRSPTYPHHVFEAVCAAPPPPPLTRS